MVAVAIPTDSRPGVLRRPVGVPDRRARVRPGTHRRVAGAGFFALALAACAVWAQAGAGGGRPGNGPLAVPGAGPAQVAAVHVWVVHPGDTVWEIARTVQPSGDIRPLVDRLTRQLHGGSLQVGQQLQMP